MNRRSFLQKASVTAAGFGILPSMEACAGNVLLGRMVCALSE